MSAQLSPFAFFICLGFSVVEHTQRKVGERKDAESKHSANPRQRAIKGAFTKPFSFSVPHFWSTFFPFNSLGLHVNLLTFFWFMVSGRLFLWFLSSFKTLSCLKLPPGELSRSVEVDRSLYYRLRLKCTDCLVTYSFTFLVQKIYSREESCFSKGETSW